MGMLELEVQFPSHLAFRETFEYRNFVNECQNLYSNNYGCPRYMIAANMFVY